MRDDDRQFVDDVFASVVPGRRLTRREFAEVAGCSAGKAKNILGEAHWGGVVYRIRAHRLRPHPTDTTGRLVSQYEYWHVGDAPDVALADEAKLVLTLLNSLREEEESPISDTRAGYLAALDDIAKAIKAGAHLPSTDGAPTTPEPECDPSA